MISALFDVREHPEWGSMGLRMQGKPHFEPLTGMAIPHDLLEHFPDDNGTLEDELQALGASLYVRDGSSYYAQAGSMYRDPSVHIASDMRMQARNYVDRSYLLRDPGITRRLDDEYLEDQIQQTCIRAVKELREEFEDAMDWFPAWLNSEEQRKRFVGWMRLGYRRAVKRYSHVSTHQCLSAFLDCQKKVDDFLKGAYEYQTVRVTINLKQSRAMVTVVEEE
jgi:hypothetical protein